MSEHAFAAPRPTSTERTRPRQHSRLIGLGASLLLTSFLGFAAVASLLVEFADVQGGVDALPGLNVMRLVASAGMLAGFGALVVGTRKVWFAVVAFGVIVQIIGKNTGVVPQSAYDTDVVFMALLLLFWRVFHYAGRRILSVSMMVGATVLCPLGVVFETGILPENTVAFTAVRTTMTVVSSSIDIVIAAGLVATAVLGLSGRLRPKDS